jgi:hypothetical protein
VYCELRCHHSLVSHWNEGKNRLTISIVAMEIELYELAILTLIHFLLEKKLFVTSRDLDCCV